MGKGQPRVIIYSNFVELDLFMLHAKFQGHRDSDYDKEVLKLFTIYGRGVHLGHATLDIYTNFRFQFRRRRLKFGFDWQSGFRDDL